MATRPVFISKNTFPFYEECNIEFQYFSGFAVSQKQKSIQSLHNSFLKKYPKCEVLEISTKSTAAIGCALSAFHLLYPLSGKEIPVECVFQGSKVFNHTEQYPKLYNMKPWEVKKELHSLTNGEITGFCIEGKQFPNKPMDFFYNWIYSQALYSHKELAIKAIHFDAFTDIEFNPAKSLNCQARSAAIFKGLNDAGLLRKCMETSENYLQIVYCEQSRVTGQMSLW